MYRLTKVIHNYRYVLCSTQPDNIEAARWISEDVLAATDPHVLLANRPCEFARLADAGLVRQFFGGEVEPVVKPAAVDDVGIGIVSAKLLVTLQRSDNRYITYPCMGLLHITEIGTNHSIICATFRAATLTGYAPPVVVRNPRFTV